jgi:hypothetical protein
VRISDRLDPATLDYLAKGGRVVLAANAELLVGKSVPGSFTPDFWCWPMFFNTSGILGLLMDPKHPALAGFPTAFHGDWQWFDIAMASTPVIVDDLPEGHRPIVQVIDNFDRSHRLSLVDGFTYNGGRLLLVACEAQKLASSVAGRAFLASLRAYAASEAFQPTVPLPEGIAERLTEIPVDFKQPGVTATATNSKPGSEPSYAIDGNAETCWRAVDDKPNVSWQVDLGRPHTLGKVIISWEKSDGYQCVVEGSDDGAAWQVLGNCPFGAGSEQIATWKPRPLRYVRITITG